MDLPCPDRQLMFRYSCCLALSCHKWNAAFPLLLWTHWDSNRILMQPILLSPTHGSQVDFVSINQLNAFKKSHILRTNLFPNYTIPNIKIGQTGYFIAICYISWSCVPPEQIKVRSFHFLSFKNISVILFSLEE